MKVALVSPYSWTHPGGVNRHVGALADHLRQRDHDVRVLAPHDGPAEDVPDWLIPFGRTAKVPFNGAMSHVAPWPGAATRLHAALREGAFDLVHVHEPVALPTGPVSLLTGDVPKVATFHAYSDNPVTHSVAIAAGARRLFDRIDVRIAVSEAAAWTGRRFYGGDYRIIPNGTSLTTGAASQPFVIGAPLKIVFVGQAVERKGLPIMLRAFEALVDHVPAQLTIVGAEPHEVRASGGMPPGVTVMGRVDEATKMAALQRADVLCAPALRGESFGMVLTEAFATGLPVVASNIPGYREVVTHDVDGLLTPPGDVAALAGALRDLALEPARLERLADRASVAARHYAWPEVSDAVENAYEDAAVVHTRPAVKRIPPRRLPPLDAPQPLRARARTFGRRAGSAAALAAVPVAGGFAIHRVGGHAIIGALLASRPAWVLLALAIMCASMALRAVAWHAALRAAPATAGVRITDTFRTSALGVLASATLPARLGEACRAVLLARRLGPQKLTLLPVLGTIVSQTLVNLLALVILGVCVLRAVPTLAGNKTAFAISVLVPLAIAAAVAFGPAALRGERLHGVHAGLHRARAGLEVLRRPRLAAVMILGQLGAWGLQLLACDVLFDAMGLHPASAIGAAAAVLFAVNVTAVVPATPSNIGVFQGACIAVLVGAYHLSTVDALGYGIVLQAVELATAFVVGVPALLREGLTLREMRSRALSLTGVTLPPVPSRLTPAAKL